MKSMFEMVKEFHEVFGCPINTTKFKDNNNFNTRTRLHEEEYTELWKAPSEENYLKELCDTLYVLIGTAVACGWDLEGAFKEVHLSNMSKLGKDNKPIYREGDNKVLKGPNYKPANMKPYLNVSKKE